MRKHILGVLVLSVLIFSCTETEAEKTVKDSVSTVTEAELHLARRKGSKEIDDREMVLVELPKDGVRFPIGLHDNGAIDDGSGDVDVILLYDKEGDAILTANESEENVFVEGFLTKSYFIGKYEVTFRLWQEVYQWATAGDGKDKGYSFIYGGMGHALKRHNRDVLNELHPVTGVSWYDCIVWCNAYSEMTGAVPVYYKKEIADESGKIKAENIKNYERFILRNAKTEKKECNSLVRCSAKELNLEGKENGYRLPSLLEWQLAARLTDKKDCIVEKDGEPVRCSISNKEWYFTKGTAVSGGGYKIQYRVQPLEIKKNIEPYANYGMIGGEGECIINKLVTMEVGSLLPNSLGIYDMSGNANEWCFDYYPKTKYPSGRVVQGGGCRDEVIFLWLGVMDVEPPASGKIDERAAGATVYGFRICKTK